MLVAGRDRPRTERAAREVGGEPVVLDLGSLAAVREVAAGLPHIDALGCNAGVQIPGALRRTADGFEETFQINFLSQLLLADLLLARERPLRRIAFVGSATHDPAQRTGMPAPFEVALEAIARGGPEGDDAGRRRYTTSKLLTTAVTGALARERPQVAVRCLDPGLMTATGLAREYPALVGRAGRLLGPLVGLLPFASTPRRSGRVLASLLLEDPAPSGAVIDWRARPARISGRARDAAFGDDILRAARAL